MLALLSKLVDFCLLLLKWPLALLVIYFYEDLFFLFIGSLANFILEANIYLIIGGLVFLITNFSYSNKFLTFEHEFTHALFAFLTFKQNIKIIVGPSEFKGAAGVCTFQNGDNWLISLSPYFFPTMTLFCALFFMILEYIGIGDLHYLVDLSIGFSIPYHLKTNYLELIHNFNSSPSMKLETDISQVGKIFSLIMIPALNFLIFYIIFSIVTF